MLLIIQPLEQRIIYRAKHFTGDTHWAFDQLDHDLNFMAEITTSDELKHVLNRAKGLGSVDAAHNGHAYQDRWVLLVGDRPYEWAEIWPQAMQMFGAGKSHTLDQLLSSEAIEQINEQV